jgi:hypothetical protein
LTAIEERTDAAGPCPEQLVDQVEYWRKRALRTRRLQLGYSPMHISAYLGHEYDGSQEDLPASPVTLAHYNPCSDKQTVFRAIASVIELYGRDALGSVLDEPDESDLLPIHPLDDADWITATEAAPLLGLYHSNVIEGVRAGRLVGHFGWRADGGWKRNVDSDHSVPAHPQIFVSRGSIQAALERRRRVSIKEAGRVLGLTAETVKTKFIETGRLDLVNERLDPAAVHALLFEIHDAVVMLVATSGPMTPKKIKSHLEKNGLELLGPGRCLQRWVNRWVSDLVEGGRLQRRLDGDVSLTGVSKRRRADFTLKAA